MIPAEPFETPVTMPVVPLTVAIPVAPLLHKPPAVASDRDVVKPTHTEVPPDIAAGIALTVIVVVTKQLAPVL